MTFDLTRVCGGDIDELRCPLSGLGPGRHVEAVPLAGLQSGDPGSQGGRTVDLGTDGGQRPHRFIHH